MAKSKEPHYPMPVGTRSAPVQRWLKPVVHFMEIEAASGGVLLACTVLALLAANSAWADLFAELWEMRFGFAFNGYELMKPLHLWINDGLMTVFFFVMGLEIKRELVLGELRDPKKAALPAAAALGGMIVPALIYYSLQRGQPGQPGWGIPMATDIAFVVGFLALLGSRVPHGLKILLLSLAIVDDIGAVAVIAFFYTSKISFVALGWAVLGFAVMYVLNAIGVRRILVYVILGAGIWLAVLKSGVHPTVAGVLMGLLTPASAWVGDKTLREVLADAMSRWPTEPHPGAQPPQKEQMRALARTVHESVAPLERLQLDLHPWVAFVIMPIFALANAGVAIDLSALEHPISFAVAGGLFFGKPIGIVLFSALAVRLGLARLPSGVSWKVMVGAGLLGGIGFTMSLFIAGLALKDELLNAGKLGTLMGSALSAAVGLVVLLIVLPVRRPEVAEREKYEPVAVVG